MVVSQRAQDDLAFVDKADPVAKARSFGARCWHWIRAHDAAPFRSVVRAIMGAVEANTQRDNDTHSEREREREGGRERERG